MLLALQAEHALDCVISTSADSPLTLKTTPVCLISSSITQKACKDTKSFSYTQVCARFF